MDLASLRIAVAADPRQSGCLREPSSGAIMGDYRVLCEIRDDELVILAATISDIAAKFATEARHAGFFDADNSIVARLTNYVFYCLSVLVKPAGCLNDNVAVIFN